MPRQRGVRFEAGNGQPCHECFDANVGDVRRREGIVVVEMKICVLKYEGASFEQYCNLGDDIQSMAAARLLPRVDGYVARDHLDKVQEPCIVSMNGYFMGEANWPPSPNVVPIFFAFHIAPAWEHVVCSPKGIEYLKRHAPIGCRDRGTVAILEKHGVEAYYSGCVTLTFDRREQEPQNGQVFVVGGGSRYVGVVPRAVRKHAIHVNQARVQLPHLALDVRKQLAKHLLDTYRERASLVITSKIHCAMPCITMGVPVVFLYDKKKRDDYRVEIIRDFLPINYVGESLLDQKLMNRIASRDIDWNPAPVDIEKRKAEIKAGYSAAFARAERRFLEQFGSV